MLEFVRGPGGTELHYRADQVSNGWVWEEVRDHDYAKVSRVFDFERRGDAPSPRNSLASAGQRLRAFHMPICRRRARASSVRYRPPL